MSIRTSDVRWHKGPEDGTYNEARAETEPAVGDDPQLQQAIRLLQLSNLELSQFVETELERNPLLERAEAGEGAPADEPGEAPSAGTTNASKQTNPGAQPKSTEPK